MLSRIKTGLSAGLSLLLALALFPASALAAETPPVVTVSKAAPAAADIAIDATNFPGAEFRDYLLAQPYGADSVITQTEIQGITTMACGWIDIKDLTGIEHFTELQTLDCSVSWITTLDLSKNTKLVELDCSSNELDSLNISGCTELKILNCSGNHLSSLDVSNNPNLIKLECARTELAAIDLSHNTLLETLDLSWDQLTALDLSKQSALTSLQCERNYLPFLELKEAVSLTGYKTYNYDYQEVNAQAISPDGGSTWYVDMAELVGSGNIGRVAVQSGGTYDAQTGLVKLDLGNPNTLIYSFDMQQGDVAGSWMMKNIYASLSTQSAALLDISFDAAGGSAVSTQKITKATAVPKPQDPIKKGYTLAGWYLDDGKGNLKQWDFATLVTKSMTLKAVWQDDPLAQLRITRLMGANRYQTSGAVHGFSASMVSGHQTIIIAAGYANSYADALVASSLSGLEKNATILTIPKGSLSAEAKTAITADSVKKVIVVGGETSVPESAMREIRAAKPGVSVLRISGANRQGTAEEVYRSYSQGTFSKTAILVSGSSFPDALAIAPWAAYTKSPLFYTAAGDASITPETAAVLKQGGFSRLLVVGGSGAVKPQALAQAQKVMGLNGAQVVRLAGTNRYATSLAVARWTVSSERLASERLSYANLGIATGEAHPDALSGSALLALSGSPIMLVDSAHLSAATAEIAANKADIYGLSFFGGDAAVPQSVTRACIQATGHAARSLELVWLPDSSVGIGL